MEGFIDQEVARHSSIPIEQLAEGAADVAWFWRVRNTLGDSRWNRIQSFAKYASAASGHFRAKMYSEAMTGKITVETLFKMVREKRKTDAVRALGLVPVEGGADVESRKLVMEEFLNGSHQYGAIRRASEKRAVALAMENLARTVDYWGQTIPS